MKKTMNVAVLVLCLLIWQGCKKANDESEQTVGQLPRQAPEESPATVEPEPVAYAFNCDDGSTGLSRLDANDDVMWVFLPERTVQLGRVPSGSGEKYSDENVSFWTNGDEVLLEYDRKSVSCTVDRFQSKVESVKLTGGDFWASGNEPGWTLEIYPGRMVFTTNYGEDRYETPSNKLSEDAGARMTVFRGDVDGKPLVVTLRGEVCVDSMSGEEFETTVRIDFGGKVLDGCGAPLH